VSEGEKRIMMKRMKEREREEMDRGERTVATGEESERF
jgi:hypothetical protein